MISCADSINLHDNKPSIDDGGTARHNKKELSASTAKRTVSVSSDVEAGSRTLRRKAEEEAAAATAATEGIV
jgi:hypothetical protein